MDILVHMIMAGGPGSGRRPYGQHRFEGDSPRQRVLSEAIDHGGKVTTSQSDGKFHQRALALGRSGHLSLDSKEKGNYMTLDKYNWSITDKGRSALNKDLGIKV